MRMLLIFALLCAPLLCAQTDPVRTPAPKPGQADFKDGEDAFTQGRMQEAVDAFTKSLVAAPGNHEALAYRAAAYVALGKLDDADRDVAEAIKLDSDFSLTWNTRGYIRWLRKDFPGAIEDFTAAIAYGADDRRIDDAGRAQMHQNRGIAYQDAGNSDRALLDFNRCVELQPKDPAYYENRGLLYVDKRLFDIAFKDFDRALELAPKNARAYVNRAWAARLMGDYEQAVRDYSQALRIKADYGPALIGRGYTWMGWQRPELAATDFVAAAKVEGYAAAGEVGLGEIELAKGEFAAASAHFTRAISLDANNTGARYGLARTQYQNKDFEAACSSLETLCVVQPDDASYWSLLADARMAGANWEGALAALDRTLAIVASDSGSHSRRLRCYAKLKLFEAAMEEASWLADADAAAGQVAFARVSALHGDAITAINALKLAKKAGADIAVLADDPDFAALKDDPTFKSLTSK